MDKRYIETLEFLKKQYPHLPETGIILGTGLGGLVNEIRIEKEIPYDQIPHFPLCTAEQHKGMLVFGKMGTRNVVVMKGRFHFYEGYTMWQITFPVRIMKLLGIHTLLISNISGAMNLQYKKGDLVIIEDHISLLPVNPLTGRNEDDFGPRFPDMSNPYDPDLIHLGWKIAKEENINIHKGVYVAVSGPNLETKAEYRFLRKAGADIVGMSTVPEVIIAVHAGLKVFAVSLVSDECDPDNLKPVNINDIVTVATSAEPKLTRLISRMITEV